MSSEINASIEEIQNIQAIPGKDRIVSAEVGGYPVVLQKATDPVEYVEGQTFPYEGAKVLYLPAGLHIPPIVGEMLGVRGHLRKGHIVKMIRLGGFPSYGVVLPLSAPFLPIEMRDMPVATNVDQWLGTSKYEPPVTGASQSFKTTREDPRLFRFTDIERMNKHIAHLADVFRPGMRVLVTEKIHGTNVRLASIEGELMVGSRKMQRAYPDDGNVAQHHYWHPLLNGNIENFLRVAGAEHKQVILFGETYGPGVQDGFTYGQNDLQFLAFDLMIDGHYQPASVMLEYFKTFNIPMVPVDYIGEWPGIEYVKVLAESNSRITEAHIREGVVLRPLDEEIMIHRLGRVILKVINSAYDELKDRGKFEDSTDE